MSALLQEALHALKLDGATTEFIRHNENLTYCLDGRYLLRIHQAAAGLHVDHSPEVRRAELAFLCHLHGKGLSVQQPVAEATLSGGTMATLLTWLDGHHITESDFTPALQHLLGTMIARMHRAGEGFHHPALRRYDAAHALALSESIRLLGERHHLHTGDIAAACQAAECIADRLHDAADAFIPVHCDLSQSNVILTAEGPVPIDFSLFGLGHPMHDLAVLLGSVRTQAERRAIAEGYAAAGGRIELPLLDAGYVLSLLEALDFHADKWPLEDWFAARLHRWAGEIFHPLASGKPILNEDMFLLNIK